MATGLRLTLEGDKVGEKLTRNMKIVSARVSAAMRETAIITRDTVVEEAQADIKSQGSFGQRWVTGFTGKITQGGGNYKVSFSHALRFFPIHMRGGLIRGNPLLWIPLSWSGARGVYARNYPGKLFRIDRHSRPPLLLDVSTGQPKYVGLREVRMKKRFRTIEIVQETSKKMKDIYRARYNAQR